MCGNGSGAACTGLETDSVSSSAVDLTWMSFLGKVSRLTDPLRVVSSLAIWKVFPNTWLSVVSVTLVVQAFGIVDCC